MIQLDLEDYAQRLKREGMALVASNNGEWGQVAYAAFLAIKDRLPDECTPEDWKKLIIPQAGKPKSWNAWGPLTVRIVREGHAIDTGKRVLCKLGPSHARETRVYRIVRGNG